MTWWVLLCVVGLIEGVTGHVGNGKSLWAVQRLVNQARKGRRCVANFHCRSARRGKPLWDMLLWDELREVDNCFIVIDESQMWFGSREWKGTGQEQLGTFQQSRKEGNDMLWVAQHQDRVDRAIREVTAYLWRTKKIGNWLYLRRFEESQPQVILEKRLWKIKPALFKHYWTTQIIGNRHGEGYGFGRSSLYGDRPELHKINGRLVIRPNYARIVTPTGAAWGALADPHFRDRLGRAVEDWRREGMSLGHEEICELFWRTPDGQLLKVTKDGDFERQSGPDQVEELLSGILPQSLYYAIAGGKAA